MMKFKLVGAAAILATAAFVTPAMSQEATQEPGMGLTGGEREKLR